MARLERYVAWIGGCLLAAGSIACGSTAHDPIDARPTPQPAPPPADSAAIHAFWATLDSTWIARDAVRFSRLFTEDASFGFVGRGTSLETRAAIRRRFTTQFRRQNPDLRHVTEIRRIHPLAADLVAIDGEVRILNARPGGSSPTLLRRFAITGVMVRTSDGWLVRLLRVFQLPTGR